MSYPKHNMHFEYQGQHRKMIWIVIVVVVVIMAIIAAVLVFVSPYHSQQVSSDLASACPHVYENDLVKFHYPCSWLLAEDGNALIFTTFHYNDKGGYTQELYLRIETLADNDPYAIVGEKFTECEGGKTFSRRKTTISSAQGEPLEACFHGEHSGQTLVIRSDAGYVSISSDSGILEQIMQSLTVK